MSKFGDRIHGRGRTKEQNEMLRRTYGDLEIVDADFNLLVMVEKRDQIGAIPLDPTNCTFSKSCHRMYHSTKVVFFATVAYIDMPDENGVVKIFRFELAPKAKEAVAVYDKDHDFEPGSYTLRAPPQHKQLETQRKNSARRRKNPKEKQKHALTMRQRRARIKAKAHTVKRRTLAGIPGLVRNGSGLVFTQRT
jgi:hypothetical protein